MIDDLRVMIGLTDKRLVIIDLAVYRLNGSLSAQLQSQKGAFCSYKNEPAQPESDFG